jgi:hypothetical protein
MKNLLANYGISPEQEKEMWAEQHVADLLYWANLSFTRKLELVEGMVEVARSMHGGKLPASADEHDEHGRLK